MDKRTAIIFYVEHAEREKWSDLAHESRTSRSSWIRQACSEKAQRQQIEKGQDLQELRAELAEEEL